jgi:hypothetical protein
MMTGNCDPLPLDSFCSDLVYCGQQLTVCADRRKSYRSVSGVPVWPSPVRIAYVWKMPRAGSGSPARQAAGLPLLRGAWIADVARAARGATGGKELL